MYRGSDLLSELVGMGLAVFPLSLFDLVRKLMDQDQYQYRSWNCYDGSPNHYLPVSFLVIYSSPFLYPYSIHLSYLVHHSAFHCYLYCPNPIRTLMQTDLDLDLDHIHSDRVMVEVKTLLLLPPVDQPKGS